MAEESGPPKGDLSPVLLDKNEVSLPFERRFNLDSRLHSTRSLVCYEAKDSSSGSRVLVWKRLDRVDSVLAALFLERMQKIKELHFPRPRIRAFDVDPSGEAFIVTDHVTLLPVLRSVRAPEQAARTILQVVKLLNNLHGKGIVLGDISEFSFLLDNSGAVNLVSYAGPSVPLSRQRTDGNDLFFVSPEERAGAAPTAASDIYAFGVYVYRLLTGKHFASAEELRKLAPDVLNRIVPPSRYPHLVPAWSDRLVASCLQWDPAKRPQSALELNSFFENIAPPKTQRRSFKELLKLTFEVSAEPAIRDSFKILAGCILFLFVTLMLKNNGSFERMGAVWNSRGSVGPSGKADINVRSLGQALGSDGSNKGSDFRERLEAASSIKTPKVDLRLVDNLLSQRRFGSFQTPSSAFELEGPAERGFPQQANSSPQLAINSVSPDSAIDQTSIAVFDSVQQLAARRAAREEPSSATIPWSSVDDGNWGVAYSLTLAWGAGLSHTAAFVAEEGWRADVLNLSRLMELIPNVSPTSQSATSPRALTEFYSVQPRLLARLLNSITLDLADQLDCAFIPNWYLRQRFISHELELLKVIFRRKASSCAEGALGQLEFLRQPRSLSSPRQMRVATPASTNP